MDEMDDAHFDQEEKMLTTEPRESRCYEIMLKLFAMVQACATFTGVEDPFKRERMHYTANGLRMVIKYLIDGRTYEILIHPLKGETDVSTKKD